MLNLHLKVPVECVHGATDPPAIDCQMKLSRRSRSPGGGPTPATGMMGRVNEIGGGEEEKERDER